MNTLPEILINKIMLYVSHPCADIIHDAIETDYNNVKFIRTQWKRYHSIVPYSIYVFSIAYANDFIIRCITSRTDDRKYEIKVAKLNILNKFQLFNINVHKMNHFTNLYLHFNRTLLNEEDEIELPDYDDFNIESDIESDYNDDV